MATTFITGIAVRPGRTQFQTACDSIFYIENPKKTRNGELVSTFRCSPRSAPLEMIHEQSLYEQETGRKVIQNYGGKKKSYLLMTIRQSFKPGEVSPEQAHRIGCELAKRFLGDKYQYVVATHIDKAHIHNHIIFNIVGNDMKKFHQTKYTPKHLREISDKLCRENDLFIVDPTEWQKRKYSNDRVTPYRTIIKNDIERCIRSAQDYDDFLNKMRKEYFVTDTGSVLKFRHRTNGQQRPIRSYTLGKGYTRQEILARTNSDEELLNSITISQKLRNIEAMIHAVGFIRENGTDFSKQSENLRNMMEQTQTLLEQMRRKITSAESISRCFSILKQNGPIYDRYCSGFMTEQEKREQESSISLYRAALSTLQENHIRADDDSRNKFRDKLSADREQAAELENRYREIRELMSRTEEVREISERVQADDAVIAQKKGGKQHGR